MSKKRNESIIEDLQTSKRLDTESQDCFSQPRTAINTQCSSIQITRINNLTEEIQNMSDEFNQSPAAIDEDFSLIPSFLQRFLISFRYA